jgi:hypothetical protein
MTEQRSQAIRESAHRLRSHLTYILLGTYTLRSDLRCKLSPKELAEFQQLDNVLEETKAVLQKLLKQLEPELKARPIKDADVQMLGIAATAENAVS